MVKRMQWHGAEVTNVISQTMSARLRVVGQKLQGYMQDKISRPGMAGIRSDPGEPPRMEDGDLRSSIFHQRLNVTTPGGGKPKSVLVEMIGSDSPVAVWQELGTGPGHHMPDPSGTGLRPVPAPRPRPSPTAHKMLHWFDYGVEHFADSTAGIQPRPFMASSLHEMADEIVSILCAPIGGVV